LLHHDHPPVFDHAEYEQKEDRRDKRKLDDSRPGTMNVRAAAKSF
jgi:hypothetical protein